jgi:hypothetical protein
MKRPTLTLSLSMLLASAHAAAQVPTRAACVEAQSRAKQASSEDRIIEARDAFLVCAHEKCPAAIRAECTDALVDAKKQISTVMLSAKDAGGKEMTDVRVLLDGKPLVEKLGGAEVEIAPGEHTFRFEAAGQKPVEKKLLVLIGEHNILVQVSIGAPEPAPAPPPPVATVVAPPPAPPAAKPAPPKPAEDSGFNMRLVPVFALGGAGVASAIAAVAFGVAAKNKASDLRGSCAPNCTSDQASSVDSKLLLSDVFLGVSVAAFAGAVIYYFVTKPAAKRAGITVPAFHF